MRPCHVADLTETLARLRTLLQQAADQSIHTSQTTLACLVLSVPQSDPLRVLRALRHLYSGTCSYWEQPARQVALVGAGTALSIETSGTTRFTDAAHIWQQTRATAVIHYTSDKAENTFHGPALFGGFSFDPLHAPTPLWQNFPAGLLTLPRLLFRQHAHQATLTLSCQVRPADSPANLAHDLQEDLFRFSQIMAEVPAFSHDTSTPDQTYQLRDIWPASAWQDLVGRTVQRIQQGMYTKVVLAREVEVTPRADDRPFDLAATLHSLRHNYPAASIFMLQRGATAFIGATPERLIHAQDGQLHTMALAGSAPRGTTEAEDRLLGSTLLTSRKNREEHEIVTTMLRASLAHLCSRVWISDTPELLRLKNIQHLQTAIVGELLPGRSILEALHTLHPTPAVGGTPTESALAYIRDHEKLDRGWYAGPIGWIDLQGNGEFAVALRSALLEKHRARLFAGCGIVKDSDPPAEYAESCLKLQVILGNLSIQNTQKDYHDDKQQGRV